MVDQYLKEQVSRLQALLTCLLAMCKDLGGAGAGETAE